MDNIDEYAFYGCTNLSSIVIPEGITTISEGTFWQCTSLTCVSVPASVISCGNAFSRSIAEVHISDLSAWCNINFKYPSCNPLYYAHHLYFDNTEITWLTIPEDVTTIANYAFTRCEGLTGITLHEGITSIGKQAFSYCSSLTNLTIPPGLTAIEEFTFSSCSNLTNVSLSPGLLSIGNNAFSNCINLRSINIPEGVQTLGFAAFRYCDSLESVSIPSTITSIEENVFFFCNSLSNVTSNIQEPFEIESVFDAHAITMGTLFVPEGTSSKYRDTPEWNQFRTIMEFSPSAIETTTIANSKKKEKQYFYKINGQHVNESTKGLLIVNGRKVIFDQ